VAHRQQSFCPCHTASICTSGQAWHAPGTVAGAGGRSPPGSGMQLMPCAVTKQPTCSSASSSAAVTPDLPLFIKHHPLSHPCHPCRAVRVKSPSTWDPDGQPWAVKGHGWAGSTCIPRALNALNATPVTCQPIQVVAPSGCPLNCSHCPSGTASGQARVALHQDHRRGPLLQLVAYPSQWPCFGRPDTEPRTPNPTLSCVQPLNSLKTPLLV